MTTADTGTLPSRNGALTGGYSGFTRRRLLLRAEKNTPPDIARNVPPHRPFPGPADLLEHGPDPGSAPLPATPGMSGMSGLPRPDVTRWKDICRRPDVTSWQTSSGSYHTPDFPRRSPAPPPIYREETAGTSRQYCRKVSHLDPRQEPHRCPTAGDPRSGDTSAPPALVSSRYSVTPTHMALRPEAWQDPGDRCLPAWKRCPGRTPARRHSTLKSNRPARLAPGTR